MAQLIGYQDGIDWLIGFLKKFPLVKYRPVGDRPAALTQWYGLEKLERTLRILKDDHDAAVVVPPTPVPPTVPPPTDKPRLAPMTHYKTDRADARYCVHAPGVTQRGDGRWIDEGGHVYSDEPSGLCESGTRSGKFVSGLKGADSMDGLEPCDGYTFGGNTYPPWPAASYEV